MKHVIHLTIESEKDAAVVRDNLVALIKDAGGIVSGASYDTPKELTDNSPFPFGKHKGVAMKDVPADYYQWLLQQDWVSGKWPYVVQYATTSEPKVEVNDEEIPF